MTLNSDNICIEIDEASGVTQGVFDPKDIHKMNWILDNASWGMITGFKMKNVSIGEREIQINTIDPEQRLQVFIEKKLENDGYYEIYTLTNLAETEFFLTKDNFGIPFPYQCQLENGKHMLDGCCTTHVWCGGNVCWMQSVKNRGNVPYLLMELIEGAIEDYSISYDISRVRNASYFRGVIVLHPECMVLLPNQTYTLSFRYQFTNETPETKPLDYANTIRFTAPKYSWLCSEKVKLTLECAKDWDRAEILCDGKSLPYSKSGKTAVCLCSFDEPGNKKIEALVDGKRTWMNVQIILPIAEILERRARFITENQQYHCEGSHLDGAYLIYDNQEKHMYYSGNIWEQDHNAGRERIGMGVIVCRQLQKKFDERMMNSLRKHRAFVERELVDTGSGMVFNDVGREPHIRIFNFPWVSTYYLEWYRLSGEKACIESAAKILLKYYELGGKTQDSQCIEAVEILTALRNEGLHDLYNRVKKEFLEHADAIMQRDGALYYDETSWSNEPPNDMCCYLSQAYIITGEEKYRNKAKEYIPMSMARFGCQPDYHMNSISLRYWDRYWFGKVRTYGDTFPHYWSTLAGWSLAWYDMACQTENYQPVISKIMRGNMCIYREDGSAANNYLYPYKVVQYTSDPAYENERMKPGIVYGKKYDDWANDQDWALYYASRFERTI